MGKTRTQNTQAQQVDRYLIVFARINVSILRLNPSCIVSHTHTQRQTNRERERERERDLIVFVCINVGVLWCNSSCILSRTHGHNTNASAKIVITK